MKKSLSLIIAVAMIVVAFSAFAGATEAGALANKNLDSFSGNVFSGWVGFKNSDIDAFGYKFEGGELVTDPAWTKTVAADDPVVAAAAGDYAYRFVVPVSTEGLEAGTHSVELYAVLQDGTQHLLFTENVVIEVNNNVVIEFDSTMGSSYMASFTDAGYHFPIFNLGYGNTIYIGSHDLSKYSAVIIEYGCDGGPGTQANFEKASSLAIGLKSTDSSFGQVNDDNFDNAIAYTQMVFSSTGWAAGARDAVVDLTDVDYNGDVWVAVHNPEGTTIAISSVQLVPVEEEDTGDDEEEAEPGVIKHVSRDEVMPGIVCGQDETKTYWPTFPAGTTEITFWGWASADNSDIAGFSYELNYGEKITDPSFYVEAAQDVIEAGPGEFDARFKVVVPIEMCGMQSVVVYADFADGTSAVIWECNPTIEHDAEYIPAVDPCHDWGCGEHWYCAGCDCYFSDEECTMNTNPRMLMIAPTMELEHIEAVESCHDWGCAEYWYCPGCECYFSDAEGLYNTNPRMLMTAPSMELEHFEEVPATATENGMKEHWYCAGCDCYFADADGFQNVARLSLVIPATGEEENPETSGVAVVAIAALASVSLAGAVVCKKRK